MRTKKADEPKKIKLPAGTQARNLIEAQIAEFLNRGGQVDQIPNGKSGYQAAVRQRPVSVEKKA
jgi:hypothetical protein